MLTGSHEVESSYLSRSTNLRAPVLYLQTDIIWQGCHGMEMSHEQAGVAAPLLCRVGRTLRSRRRRGGDGRAACRLHGRRPKAMRQRTAGRRTNPRLLEGAQGCAVGSVQAGRSEGGEHDRHCRAQPSQCTASTEPARQRATPARQPACTAHSSTVLVIPCQTRSGRCQQCFTLLPAPEEGADHGHSR